MMKEPNPEPVPSAIEYMSTKSYKLAREDLPRRSRS
jgi:hypothetical protein